MKVLLIMFGKDVNTRLGWGELFSTRWKSSNNVVEPGGKR